MFVGCDVAVLSSFRLLPFLRERVLNQDIAYTDHYSSCDAFSPIGFSIGKHADQYENSRANKRGDDQSSDE